MLRSPTLAVAFGLPGLALLLGCAVVHPPGPAAPAPAAASSTSPVREVGAPRSPAPREGERGKASYYADSLAGRKTASGERYDTELLTAAHRTLPFGTWVEVRRDDGRAVRVRINDRGPFAKGRVIDLSRAAAESIGMIRAGVVEVTVVVVDGP